MKARILYKTDCWHKRESNVLVGIFTSKLQFEKTTMRLIVADIKENYEEEDGKNTQDEEVFWQYTELMSRNQTFGLPTDELIWEEQEVNILF